MLHEGEIGRIFRAVAQEFNLAQDAEVTLESNPGTLTLEKLAEYRASGVNRLSVGVQSFDDGVLRAAGRIHTAKEAEQAVLLAEAAGFTNVNVDLMAGLPAQTQDSLCASVRTALALPVQHISLYSLILEEGTPLFADVADHRVALPEEDAVCDMLSAAEALLKESRFSRYEVSNWARPGYACRHNIVYWQSGDFYAAGLGASAAVRRQGRTVRTRNCADFASYYAAVEEGRLPVAERTEESGREEAFTYIMMALRMTDGFPEAEFERRFGAPFVSYFEKPWRRAVQQGWMTAEKGKVKLTARGLDIMNTVLCDFL